MYIFITSKSSLMSSPNHTHTINPENWSTFCHCKLALYFLKLHMDVIIQYKLFWIFFLSVMFLKFVHVVEYKSSEYLYIVSKFYCMDKQTRLSIYLLMDIWDASSCSWVVVHKVITQSQLLFYTNNKTSGIWI